MPELQESQGLRVAIEGCGHGVLHSIYASVAQSCQEKGWPGVDLLIIGGDFQSVRNASDLTCVSMPAKYREMHDFHEYYSGARTAPYLTVFVGGNHEASNYLFELYYGGWVAPNIYYMGAANVLRVGPVRIAGLSGIWKGYNYKKPHYERLPYSQDDLKSIYHVRELDVRKLLLVRTQVVIGVSHDWPRGVEWKGNFKKLFRQKNFFEEDARKGQLGSVAAKYVMDRLRPPYWFSAHLHCKYSAIVQHDQEESNQMSQQQDLPKSADKNDDEIDLDLDMDDDVAPKDAPASQAIATNTDEIDLELEEANDSAPLAEVAPGQGLDGVKMPVNSEQDQEQPSEVPEDVRSQLPAAFARPTKPAMDSSTNGAVSHPDSISNKTTHFLALDKCLPNRDFLQLLSIPSYDEPTTPVQRPAKLEFDKEWLAITRVFAQDLVVGDEHARILVDRGESHYRTQIEAEEAWVEEHLVKTGRMAVPENFQVTAPVYDASRGLNYESMPREYSNNQTKDFCGMLQIPNPFDISEEDRDHRLQQGPKESERRDNNGDSRGRALIACENKTSRTLAPTAPICKTPQVTFQPSTMTISKFVEFLDEDLQPSLPGASVSLEDVIEETRRLEESRQRSTSTSSTSSTENLPPPPTSPASPVKTRLRAFSIRKKSVA
ncbi:hypothetical protein MBLNU457_1194t1 [Dothideomycetes sp. NU457]